MTTLVTGGLRRPLFVVAVVAIVLVVLTELGMSLLLSSTDGATVSPDTAVDLGVDLRLFESATLAESSPPGTGIAALAFLDGLLAFTIVMLGLGLVIPDRLYGRIQGVVTLIVALLWMLAAAVAIFVGIAKLFLMMGLLGAVPFGTIAYLAIWGGFPVSRAATILGLVLFLKLAFVAFLVAAQPRFLKVKGLVLLVVVSCVAQIVLVFIHGFLPRPVVAIGDQFWAIIVTVIALIWALVMLIGSIPAIVKAIRVSRSLTE